MAKLDYIKAILYGVLLAVLSCVTTLVATMLITKSPKIALILCVVTPVILMSAYFIVIIKIPEKIGCCTDEDQKHWQIKLIFLVLLMSYMITSLGVFYMKSQIVGKVMLLTTPLFLLFGKGIDIFIKKKEPTG